MAQRLQRLVVRSQPCIPRWHHSDVPCCVPATASPPLGANLLSASESLPFCHRDPVRRDHHPYPRRVCRSSPTFVAKTCRQICLPSCPAYPIQLQSSPPHTELFIQSPRHPTRTRRSSRSCQFPCNDRTRRCVYGLSVPPLAPSSLANESSLISSRSPASARVPLFTAPIIQYHFNLALYNRNEHLTALFGPGSSSLSSAGPASAHDGGPFSYATTGPRSSST